MAQNIKNYDKQEILNDFRIANVSRFCSIIGRKEVLTGKAKFGIFGDGKEVAQIAFAKEFRQGDWRSGYYRDQTFMMAAGIFSPEELFAQLYGETDLELNPGNGGRSFNNHFSTRSMNPDGTWKRISEMKNSSPDISPTAGQMPRLVGLAYASKLFRENKELHSYTQFSKQGNEVAFGTIGDASTSEGHFWEAINAVCVLKVPMALSIWDDGYGISVPQKYQTTKQNLSELLSGFQMVDERGGLLLYSCDAFDYPALRQMYAEGVKRCREEHVPVVFHVRNVTQPLGHSTSGSHERYKSAERLQWEIDNDPITKMRQWIIESEYATDEELDEIVSEAENTVKEARKKAFKNFTAPLRKERDELNQILNKHKRCMCANHQVDKVTMVQDELNKIIDPIRKDNMSSVKKILRNVCMDCPYRAPLQKALSDWLKVRYEDNQRRYSSHLYNETEFSVLKVQPIPPVYSEKSEEVHGRVILRENYDRLFAKNPLLVTFGEDTGYIGGVNQSLEGLQKKYGELRITDTGIRENTILGQGIGLALRGLRPIAEIQYFDYLLYALQTMSDDLATLHYRTVGGQIAPVIVSTRGHRLEGIWHSGSPLSMVINSIRGVYVCVPRNMTQAAGFYNTLLEGMDSALVIEPLNGYRIKERMPDNIGEYRIPLGIPEIIEQGTDLTLVTYGSCVKIAQEAVKQLKEFNVNVELIDVQTLIPFDRNDMILESIKKTGKVVFFDEDVPGGATAFMMQKVVEERNAFVYLDMPPRTLASQEHRPAYATDGDYFSNPNAENVFELIYDMMHEYNPIKYPQIY